MAVEPLGERGDVRGADALVDVAPVGLDRDRVDVRAQPAEDLGRHAVGGAVRAVEQDAEPAEVERREAQLELAQVVVAGAVQLAQAAYTRARLLQPPLDLGLLLIPRPSCPPARRT